MKNTFTGKKTQRLEKNYKSGSRDENYTCYLVILFNFSNDFI